MMNNIPEPLSASNREGFAFITLRDRLPIIITKVIDYLYRQRDHIASVNETDGKEELKAVTNSLAHLKNELQTDKSFTTLSYGDDKHIWNDYLNHVTLLLGKTPTWFSTTWLYAECYMYRRIYQSFLQSSHLKNFDYFAYQKDDSFYSSLDAIRGYASFLHEQFQSPNYEAEIFPKLFDQLIKVSLWSNKCDLSLSAGAAVAQKDNPIAALESLQANILVDDTRHIWNKFQEIKSKDTNGLQLSIILDNAGFELFCDLCFAHFLTTIKIVHTVQFYVKAYPWYVSDTTERDILWTLNTMESLGGTNNEVLNQFGRQWSNFFKNKTWTIEKANYWTTPFDYAEMQSRDVELYKKLVEADLAIFKGDLNYRKLLGDRGWNPEVPFEVALRGFHPTSVCSLRTLKADVIAGLQPGQSESLTKSSPGWQITGEYAVIQISMLE